MSSAGKFSPQKQWGAGGACRALSLQLTIILTAYCCTPMSWVLFDYYVLVRTTNTQYSILNTGAFSITIMCWTWLGHQSGLLVHALVA